MKNMEKSEEKKKCTKCEKVRKKMMPQLILGFAFLGLSIYGLITIIKDIIELLGK
jgi:hypothetical protein